MRYYVAYFIQMLLMQTILYSVMKLTLDFIPYIDGNLYKSFLLCVVRRCDIEVDMSHFRLGQ